MAHAQERASSNAWGILSLSVTPTNNGPLAKASHVAEPATTAEVDQLANCGKALQSHMGKGTEERRGENYGHLCELSPVRMNLNNFFWKGKAKTINFINVCIYFDWEEKFSTGNTKLMSTYFLSSPLGTVPRPKVMGNFWLSSNGHVLTECEARILF